MAAKQDGLTDKLYVLYEHVNNINGKKYFGITSQQPPSKRWCNGKGHKNNLHFSRAIDKYGWNNFSHVVLFDNLSQEKAEKLEQKYIAKYNTQNSENGYNIAAGGKSCTGWHMNNVQVEALKERLHKQFDTPEKRKNWGDKHRGCHRSEEPKKEISLKRMGKNNPAAKSVICQTGESFATEKEAASWCGIKSYSKIGFSAKHLGRQCGKYPITGEPLYWSFCKEVA